MWHLGQLLKHRETGEEIYYLGFFLDIDSERVKQEVTEEFNLEFPKEYTYINIAKTREGYIIFNPNDYEEVYIENEIDVGEYAIEAFFGVLKRSYADTMKFT